MMKLINTLAAIFISCLAVSADSIQFRKIPYSQLFELAKKENKPVMIYFHFDGCGACYRMGKEVFVDKAVADYYNKNFICYEMNSKKGEGIEIAKKYDPYAYPAFIYCDLNGQELHRKIGSSEPEKFIDFGRTALDPKRNLSTFRNEFKKGKREGDFLLEYCYKLRDAYQLDSAMIYEYLHSQTDEQLSSEKNIRFIYEFCIYHVDIVMPYKSREFNFMLNNRELFGKYFNIEQVNTRVVWIAFNKAFEAVNNKDEALVLEIEKLLVPFEKRDNYMYEEMDGRVTGWINNNQLLININLYRYDKWGDSANYLKTLKVYSDSIWNDSYLLNEVAWEHYEKHSDIKRLEIARDMALRSVELKPGFENSDTYASLLYKLGDHKNALIYAEKAVEIAKKEGKDYSATSQLIEKIKEKGKG